MHWAGCSLSLGVYVHAGGKVMSGRGGIIETRAEEGEETGRIGGKNNIKQREGERSRADSL
jgi:hypothetical protein